MSKVKWIKVSTGIFDNRKIKQIEAMPKGDTIVTIWFKLLCLAGVINDGGAVYITPELPYTVKGLAAELGRPQTIVQKALDTFNSFDMIEIDDGFIKLPSWDKYQDVDGLEKIKEQNRKRKQKQRERDKAPAQDILSCDSHVTVTQCHDTEEEREKEREGDKEFHSFILKDKKPVFSESVTESVTERHELGDNQRDVRKPLGGIGQDVVLLSENQIDHLLSVLSMDEFDHYVGVVANCELNGKPFKRKTHYQAIIDMAKKDRKISV